MIYDRYNDDGETEMQYIGDGGGMYSIDDLPILDEASVLAVFDVPEKQRGDWYVRREPIPSGINFDDADRNERIADELGIEIRYKEKSMKPVMTSKGTVLIDAGYLDPIQGTLDMTELYERETDYGTTYITAKAGLIVQALIAPVRPTSEELKKCLKAMQPKRLYCPKEIKMNTATGELVEAEGEMKIG